MSNSPNNLQQQLLRKIARMKGQLDIINAAVTELGVHLLELANVITLHSEELKILREKAAKVNQMENKIKKLEKELKKLKNKQNKE